MQQQPCLLVGMFFSSHALKFAVSDPSTHGLLSILTCMYLGHILFHILCYQTFRGRISGTVTFMGYEVRKNIHIWGLESSRGNLLPAALPSHTLLVLIRLSVYSVCNSRIMCSAIFSQNGISLCVIELKMLLF